MLVIALVGGAKSTRDDVVKQFIDFMNGSGAVYSIPDTIPDDKRLPLLRNQFNPRSNPNMVLLLNNLATLDEFNWVRQIGGYIAHVDGLPSNIVPMQKHDFYVTPRKTERRMFETMGQFCASIKAAMAERPQRPKPKFSETVS